MKFMNNFFLTIIHSSTWNTIRRRLTSVSFLWPCDDDDDDVETFDAITIFNDFLSFDWKIKNF